MGLADLLSSCVSRRVIQVAALPHADGGGLEVMEHPFLAVHFMCGGLLAG
jgi:hypothetical protein